VISCPILFSVCFLLSWFRGYSRRPTIQLVNVFTHYATVTSSEGKLLIIQATNSK